MRSPSRWYFYLLRDCDGEKVRRYSTVKRHVFSRITKLLGLWSKTTLTAFVALTWQGCDRIVHVDEDQTSISEEVLTKARGRQRDLNTHRNLAGFGYEIGGIAMQRDIAPIPAGRLEQLKINDELIGLYMAAAGQTPIQRELFQEIEDLEWRDRDYAALLWWWDCEARAYPDSASEIEKLKTKLPADTERRHVDRATTVNLLTQSGYFSPAVLDDFQREEPRINVRVYCLDGGDEIRQLLQAEANVQTKLSASSPPHGFDIAMVPDSTVAALVSKGLLAPVSGTAALGDREFQSNMRLVDNDFHKWMSSQGSSMNIDLNRYCIPYYWSLTGIAYNSTFVDELPFSWGALLYPVHLGTDSAKFGRTSMLLEPRLAIKTALLYLANLPVEPPNLRTIESAERLLTDSAAVCKRLPELINEPESEFLIADLTQFLRHLQEPLGHSAEELARMLSQVQDEIVWLLLKLDLMLPSAPGQNSSSTKIEPKQQWLSPLGPLLPIASGSLSEVVTSMRQLILITYDDLYSAVSFLKRLADIEHRNDLLLGGNPRDNSDIKIIQAAIQTLNKGLNSKHPQPPSEIAEGFSAVQRRADALLDPTNGFNPEGKLAVAIDLLFRGPGTTDVGKTANNALLLAKQDTSEGALENPDTQRKISSAFSYLQNQASYVSYFFTDSDTVTALESGKVVLGQASGRDAAMAALKNERIAFALPVEGVLGTAECFVILNYASTGDKRNIRECRQLLNYLLRPQNAAKMANYSKYASTESAAATFIDRGVLNGASYMQPHDLSTVGLLTTSNDETEKTYARAAVPIETSKVLLEHPEYKKTRSLFGVLFQVQRPNRVSPIP